MRLPNEPDIMPTIELQVVENLRVCAIDAGKASVPELEIIFGGLVNAIKAGKLEKLATHVSRFLIDEALTAPL